MLSLAKHVSELKEELPGEKLNDVVEFIVQGCVMCVSQMTNHSLFRVTVDEIRRFISASVNAEDIEDFESELGQRYKDLTVEALKGVLTRTPHHLPPTQGEYPDDAVGIIEAQGTVIGLLQVEGKDQTKRAVVIYGFGGVGKTTLATAVFSQLKLKDNNYKFCKLMMDELCSNEHIKVLQRQLLYDLFGQNIELRDHVEGQVKLKEAFSRTPTQPVFMFIDNALKKDDLAKLLPSNLSCLPHQTRILLTTRKLDESSTFLQQGIPRYEYRVDRLKIKESKQILCKNALGSADGTFPPGVDIDGLVEICGGIPLVLEIVGSRLSEHVKDVSICNEIIDSLKESLREGGEEEISERVVDVVYNGLNQDCKEALLDIACFFHNEERSFVSYVVGDLSLKTLENAAFVKISHDPPTSLSSERFGRSVYLGWCEFLRGREGFLEVHDIVRARGRKLSQIQSDRRILNEESWAEAVQDAQNLKKIKGICITNPTRSIKIDAEDLDLMHASLRTLYIGREIKMNGKCQKDFINLRCISVAALCVDFAELKRMRVLRVNFSNNPTEFPTSLRYLELTSVPGFQLSLDESFGKLSSLKELHLENYVVVPPSFGHLKSLCVLSFFGCEMVALPQSFGSLSALEVFSIVDCDELRSLPSGFGELQKLAFLEVIDCPKLSSLSEGFVNLSSLKELRLEGCSKLVSLPNNFGRLKSLGRLEAIDCSDLKEEVMDILVKMESLEGLCIEDSPMLIKRWKELGEPLLASGHALESELGLWAQARRARVWARARARPGAKVEIWEQAEARAQELVREEVQGWWGTTEFLHLMWLEDDAREVQTVRERVRAEAEAAWVRAEEVELRVWVRMEAELQPSGDDGDVGN